MCRDPLLLSNEEAEALLEPVLTGPQAKLVAKQRPLSVEDAARLFGRDVVGLVPFQHLMMGVYSEPIANFSFHG